MTLLTVVLLMGCGDSGGYVVLHADGGWPTETLQDWVSYGDQLSVITIIRETAPEKWPEYKNSGGLLGRRVTARIERTLWRRDEAPPRPPDEVGFGAWGWMMDSDQHPFSSRSRVVGEHEPRPEVGQRYLAVLAKDEEGWFPIGHATMTLAADGTVTSKVVAGGPTAGAAALRGKSVEEAARLLTATPAAPMARKYAALPPRRRWEKVARAGEPRP